MATKKKTAEAAVEPVQEPEETKDASQTEEPVEAVQEAASECSEAAQDCVIEEGVAFVEYAVKPLGGLRLRTEPRLDAPILAVLPCGAGVMLDAHDEGDAEWVNVRTGTLNGWVKAQFLTPVLLAPGVE